MKETTYDLQNNWRELMANLPKKLQLDKEQMPLEETWEWNGNGVHIDRYENADAPCKIILHHGVGTNGRQMTLLVGHRLAEHGYAIVAPDNLGYGVTNVNQSSIQYEDWVNLMSDLIDAELKRDNQPVFLFGLSAGGMLCVHAAGKNKKVQGIIGLTFMDQRINQVVKETVIHPLMALTIPMVKWMGKMPIVKNFRVPMKWVAKMYTLHNDKKLLKIFLKDRSSSGALVSLEFLSSLVSYQPVVEASDFDICPILLAQPAEDRWTPEHLSTMSLEGVKSEFIIKYLDNASHYPSEDPGVDQLLAYILDFVKVKGIA
jgi:pimeloyl-ACP methyl ester carboxylesterase